jgi:hypothetical protein
MCDMGWESARAPFKIMQSIWDSEMRKLEQKFENRQMTRIKRNWKRLDVMCATKTFMAGTIAWTKAVRTTWTSSCKRNSIILFNYCNRLISCAATMNSNDILFWITNTLSWTRWTYTVRITIIARTCTCIWTCTVTCFTTIVWHYLSEMKWND